MSDDDKETGADDALLDEFGLGGAEPGESATATSTDDASAQIPLPASPSKDAFDLLGELIEKSPAFAQYAAKRAAVQRPLFTKVQLPKSRDYRLSLGPVWGAAGSTTTISVVPQCLFRGEKLIATDTSNNPGHGTRIGGIFVGSKLQRPNVPVSTSVFANNVLGSGVKWDTCQPAMTFSVQVSFIESCTFYADLFGKAVI